MTTETRLFDVAHYLKEPETAIEYLRVVFEDGDLAEIRQALNQVARAYGITDMARATGLSREALYKALGENGNPTLSTFMAVLKVLGLKLSVAA